ncbi:MAG: hypothetical protein E6Q88_03695 [Lysobacteraceae bacterium]|nr:MAG: hypothetical protein E6Q88_03695 [Xanthomonadaceae bacterium]
MPLVALLCMPFGAVSAIEIDGELAPEEWRDARRIDDFRHTQPLSRAPATLPTEIWIQSTPEGLAVAFRNVQPPSVPRTRIRTQRDEHAAVDRVNLYVDFDGDGRLGYNFMVTLAGSLTDATITNENQFNTDWDGKWQAAVAEDDEAWTAEMLIPWHIAPMRQAGAVGSTRTISVSFDRVIGSLGERVSWPAVSFMDQRFLSAFAPIELPFHDQSLLAITPYVTSLHDVARGRAETSAGADLFWKPNGRFQLSSTFNPDFGQVESDELVVNFSAIETFFSDKRPFFTENQGFFEVPFGALDTRNQLIYTRRIGAPMDDGSGRPGDVAVAAKINGSVGGTNYGVFAASESGDAGRDFYAVRASREFGKYGIGATATRVERPWFNRVADAYQFDWRWAPNDGVTIYGGAVGSVIEQNDAVSRDFGAQARIEWDMGEGWRQQFYALHSGGGLELNDFGYLERADLNLLSYDLGHRSTGFPDGARYKSSDWHFALVGRRNDRGLKLGDSLTVSRQGELRDGGNDYLEASWWASGYDDLITRGHGAVRMPSRLYLHYERFRPRQGDSNWEWSGEANYRAEGLGGVGRGEWSLSIQPTFRATDSLSFFAETRYAENPDWLLWIDGDRLGTFRSRLLSLNAGSVWLIDTRQELRVRLEATGLDADARRSWRVGPGGRPLPALDAVENFGLRNLAFQIRYRYELAPLSNLYIAYVRGGSLFESGVGPFDAIDEFRDALELRDSEQILVKISYRFEI